MNDEGEHEDLPWKYISYILRTKVYFCSPDEFDQMAMDDVLQDLDFYNLEQKKKNVSA